MKKSTGEVNIVSTLRVIFGVGYISVRQYRFEFSSTEAKERILYRGGKRGEQGFYYWFMLPKQAEVLERNTCPNYTTFRWPRTTELIVFYSLCVCPCTHMHNSAHMEVRRQLARPSSLFALCGSCCLNSSHQVTEHYSLSLLPGSWAWVYTAILTFRHTVYCALRSGRGVYKVLASLEWLIGDFPWMNGSDFISLKNGLGAEERAQSVQHLQHQHERAR